MLALRDIDILDKINRKTKCIVIVRMSTYDDALAERLEPGTSLPSERFSLMQQLTERGITVIVNLAPILPFINDDPENIQGLLSYCVKADVYGILTDKMCPVLREGNRERFYQQLYKYFPDIYDQYEKAYADEKTLKTNNYTAIMACIRETCEAHGIQYDKEELLRFTREYKNKTIGTQLSLFDMM